MSDKKKPTTRREFLKTGLRAAGVVVLGGALGSLVRRGNAGETVWQIDPAKCTQCGLCVTACVLAPSAVKAVHQYAMCGYCNLCFGYFTDQRADNGTGAENQRCPTDAIRRSFVEDPYYQYVIDEPKCIGCGICVKGCGAFGNGSLFLQVRHDRCLNCNECAIAAACPAQAFVRVPADHPYLYKTRK
ncbi:MAG TPA: 4Fe-4S binding protein [Armatimonadota bacterium]|jgi:electron transport complex protein RnfB